MLCFHLYGPIVEIITGIYYKKYKIRKISFIKNILIKTVFWFVGLAGYIF